MNSSQKSGIGASGLAFHSHCCSPLERDVAFTPPPPPSKLYQGWLPLPVWRKLRAKVGQAQDKCFCIWQRNHTTQLAGTIHVHHVQRWVAVQPDYCLPATVFVNNAPVYTVGTHSIHIIVLSQLARVKALKPPARSPLWYECRKPF